MELASFFELLGCHHINERELKSVFRFFKRSASLKDRVWTVLLESLKKIAVLPPGPDVYFNFPGYPESVRC